MSMTDWARSEVEFIREAFKKDDDIKDYAMACYETALKAFETVCEAGLTGFQVPIVKQIFDALIDGRPLSKLEESPDIWSDKLMSPEEKGKKFQCIRKSSLFKTIHEDGSVSYSDVDRVTVHKVITGTYWHSGFITRMIDEMFPITFPYCPPKNKYVVYVREYLTDRKNGDFDTLYVMSVTCPDGKIVGIHKFYKDFESDLAEIEREEFDERVRMHKAREAAEKEKNNENH